MLWSILVISTIRWQPGCRTADRDYTVPTYNLYIFAYENDTEKITLTEMFDLSLFDDVLDVSRTLSST